MSDRWPAVIHFGPIPAVLVTNADDNELAEYGRIEPSGFSFDGDGLDRLPDGAYVGTYSDDEAAYGLECDQIQSLMAWCVKHEVPYTASDEGRYEFAGSAQEYVPGREPFAIANTQEGWVLTSGEWEDIRQKPPAEVVAEVDRRFGGVMGRGTMHPTDAAFALLQEQRQAAAQ